MSGISLFLNFFVGIAEHGEKNYGAWSTGALDLGAWREYEPEEW